MCIGNTSYQLCFIYGGLVMYDEFAKWLDRILDENMPLPGVAINFNIYEEVDFHWSIQLISSTYFDEEDEDWNCYEEFTTGEDLYEWQQGVGWEKILDISCEMIRKYLTEGKYAEKLKKYEAVAAGFVDGDVEILYRR